jgi:hypothetical protein
MEMGSRVGRLAVLAATTTGLKAVARATRMDYNPSSTRLRV